MTDALVGRSVLVTGASSGIGAATALALAHAGARVLATARNADALGALTRSDGGSDWGGDAHTDTPTGAPSVAATVARTVMPTKVGIHDSLSHHQQSRGWRPSARHDAGKHTAADPAVAPRPTASHGIETLAGDLLDPGFVQELAARAADCDVLIANAGRLKHAPFLESRREDWRAVFDLNVLATLDLVQRVATRMAARRRGHIVLVSSLLARRVTRNTLVYAASKHAIAAIAAGLRLELEGHGIRVTEIAPGLVRTGAFRGIDHPAARDAYAALAFDFLRPEDVAAAILNAVTAPPGVCADLIEIRPLGQP